jgi:hypothetical protein
MNVHSSFKKTQTPLKTAWMRARKAETRFAVKLRKIAGHISDIIAGFDPHTGDGWKWMREALQLIGTRARSVATRMVAEVAARDKQTWREASGQIGRSLHQEIERHTGYSLHALRLW